MSKKPVDFVSAMQTFESREGVQRHPKPPLVTTSAPAEPAAQPASVTGRVHTALPHREGFDRSLG